VQSETPHGLVLDCGDATTCRISLLEPDLARILVVPAGAPPNRHSARKTIVANKE